MSVTPSTTEVSIVSVDGGRYQVQVNGKPHGETFDTKKDAEAFQKQVKESGASEPTPTERANKLLNDGASVKQNEERIKGWQEILEKGRDKGAERDKLQVFEEFVAAGDKWMAENGEDAAPAPAPVTDAPVPSTGDPVKDKRAAAAKKAAATRAAKAAKAAADKVAEEKAATEKAEGRRTTPRQTTISKEGTQVCVPKAPLKKCVVAPGKPQPVYKFPTVSADKRGTECRACRNERLKTKKESS